MSWNVDKRRGVWRALYQDDPQQLAKHLTSVQDVRDAYSGLWKPKKYPLIENWPDIDDGLWKPKKDTGKKDTHLLDVILLQKTGVNRHQGGALRCYHWLNAAFPEAYTPEEKERGIQKYQKSIPTNLSPRTAETALLPPNATPVEANP